MYQYLSNNQHSNKQHSNKQLHPWHETTLEKKCSTNIRHKIEQKKMPGFVLFETTDSVIEVLWDVALAFFVVRIAFVYFALTCVSGLAASYLFYQRLLPVSHLTTPQTELALLPLMLVLTTLWSRFIIVSYEIPKVTSFRIFIGTTALAFMVLAEFITGLVLYEGGHGDWILKTDVPAGLASVGVLIAFGLMPRIMMSFEGKPDDIGETSHGHEKKSVVDAM